MAVQQDKHLANSSMPTFDVSDSLALGLARREIATLTVVTNSHGNLTKTFLRNPDGLIVKSAAAKLARGTFEVKKVSDLVSLDDVLSGLQSTQAVTYGRPLIDKGSIVSKSSFGAASDAITRSRENFHFVDGAGVLMLDYDPPKDESALSPLELLTILRNACSFLVGVGMLWRPSSSSGIDGTGIRGQRIYIMLDDARQISRIGKIIYDRLWLAGSGYFNVSKSGQFLDRSCIDASVWKPEGLDFAAEPVLLGNVSRTHFESQIHQGVVLKCDDVLDLSESDLAKNAILKSKLRVAMGEKVASVKMAYMAASLPLMKQHLEKMSLPADDDSANFVLNRAIHHNVLMGNWPLITRDGEEVSVGLVLDNPEKWHNTRFADPLEPDVDNRVAWLNLRSGGRPFLYSHLHGGSRYILERAPSLIKVEAGQLPEMVDALAEILRKYGSIYEQGGGLVYVNNDAKIVPVKPQWLTVYAQRQCRFERYDKTKKEYVPTTCPPELTNGFLSHGSIHQMPKLTAVRTAPTVDASGRLISLPGYDAQSGLLLINDSPESWSSVPAKPTHDELLHAMRVIWKPFMLFPYADIMDASVALAAVLTAAVRPCLRTAPGFGFSATAAGTGKTLIAQCIGTLYDGVMPSVSAPITQEEEWSKSLFSSVLGGTGTLLFDNAEHPIESASLCAATTSASIKGRVLGESREAEAEHRMLILLTGNGLQLVGDLNRRFLVCRLDAKMEASKIVGREFDIDPLGYCRANRLKIITAALTLIQGYVVAGFPRVCDGMASMDDWNKLVRSTIVWLISEKLATGFTDPKKALDRDAVCDPDALMLSRLIDATKNSFGNSSFSVAALIKRRYDDPDGMGDVLNEIAGERGDVNPRRLGRWLLSREGRITNGLKLVRDGKTRNNVAQWKVGIA